MRPSLLLLVGALALAGCTTIPTSPAVMVLPGSAKSFEAFQVDDAQCRAYASQQIGASPAQAAGERAAAGAAIGTGVGAASGALIGAAAGDAGAGAAIGAGAGLLMGSAAGASHGQWVGMSLQERYDTAYMQCMYAKGNQIPVWGAVPEHVAGTPLPPPPARIPPPPPGPPPAPPPGAS